MKVVILGNWATNKGDRAIIVFMINELKRKEIRDITVTTTEPSKWNNEPGMKEVRFISFGWNEIMDSSNESLLFKGYRKMYNKYMTHINYPLVREKYLKDKEVKINLGVNKEYIKAIKEADLVICTGGHHFTTIRYEDSIFSLLYDLLLVDMFNKKYILWAQTLGPFEFKNNKNKHVMQKIIKNAQAIFVREEYSKQLLKSEDYYNENVLSTYDSVFGLSALIKPVKLVDRKNIVGVSIFNGLEESIKNSKSAMISLLKNIKDKDYKVRFFKMEFSDSETRYIKNLIKEAQVEDICAMVDFEVSIMEHIQMISECKIFVGHKTHSIIMALTTNTPLVALAYHQKTVEFMKDFGLEEYAIKDEEINPNRLNDLFNKVEKNIEEIYKIMESNSHKIGNKVQEDFNRCIKEN